MGFPLNDPLPGQFDYILQDIRAGVELPDHFAEDEEPEEEASTYVRWWENPADPDYERYQSARRRG